MLKMYQAEGTIWVLVRILSTKGTDPTEYCAVTDATHV